MIDRGHLHGEEMAAGRTIGRRLWFCSETLFPGIRVDVTLTRLLQTRYNHSWVFPGGSGLIQRDNALCHTAKIVKEWFEEHEKELKVLPQISI